VAPGVPVAGVRPALRSDGALSSDSAFRLQWMPPHGGRMAVETLPSRVTYSIDGDDRIHAVDEAWLSFARLNDAPKLTREGVIGRSLWDFVNGTELRRLYGILVEKVRADDLRILLPFRCDSPEERREMRLCLSPMRAGSVRFDGFLVSRRPRPWLAMLHPTIPRSDLRVEICGICRRLRTHDGGWAEMEDIVVTMNLFVSPRPPALIESICPGCRIAVTRLTAVGEPA